MRFLAIILVSASMAWAAAARAEPVAIVAAENFYGDVASQIGGEHVAVTSILTNPDQDPHSFEASASTARALSAARIVVENGAGYDAWVEKLLAGSPNPKRLVIDMAAVLHVEEGHNPHLWYDPATMPGFAQALQQRLIALDPAHRVAYDIGTHDFLGSLAPLNAEVAVLKAAYAGVAVTATEPVFGLMAAAIGLKMRNFRFQLAVMNDTEPGASDVAAFEDDLRGHRVRVLFFNNQTGGALSAKMLAIAKEAGVPAVGVSETEPPEMHYQDWMMTQLKALEVALSSRAK
jgi:zinc/manganese transport system substrate-binding protein